MIPSFPLPHGHEKNIPWTSGRGIVVHLPPSPWTVQYTHRPVVRLSQGPCAGAEIYVYPLTGRLTYAAKLAHLRVGMNVDVRFYDDHPLFLSSRTAYEGRLKSIIGVQGNFWDPPANERTLIAYLRRVSMTPDDLLRNTPHALALYAIAHENYPLHCVPRTLYQLAQDFDGSPLHLVRAIADLRRNLGHRNVTRVLHDYLQQQLHPPATLEARVDYPESA